MGECSVFHTRPRDRLGETSWKRPVLCRVGRKTTTQSVSQSDGICSSDAVCLQANPPQFDRVEDLAQLRYLNESCILHTLRQRYAGNLVHSYAGQSLVVINPMHALSIYSDKVIYSVTLTVYPTYQGRVGGVAQW